MTAPVTAPVTAAVRIAGYASRFDVPDAGGDIVRPGAFDGAGSKALPLLWAHDVARPVGRVVSLREDARGLRMVAEVAVGSADGANAVALMRAGAATGLSFGYHVRRARALPGGGRELLALDVIECSIVALPMHPGARVTAVDMGQEVEAI